MYIKGTQGTWKCALDERLPFIYRLKWYALFIIEITETSIYRQWFVILHFKIGLAYIVVIKQTLQIYLATQTWIQGELQIYLRVKLWYKMSYTYIWRVKMDTSWATKYVTSQVLIQDELQVYIRVKLWYRMSYKYI